MPVADFACPWKGDLGLTPSGDLAMVDGNDLVEQHIVRRLLTSVGGMLFHPEYGGGLPQRIGRVAAARNIRSLVLSQINLEATVAPVPLPTVTVIQNAPGLFVIGIVYTSAITGKPVEISLEVPGSA